ncbi:glutamate ligase domain-containing protein, partial [Burkholderia pseudomallei]
LAAGVPLAAIKVGLEAFAPVKGRLQVARAAAGSLAGATVIDDTYNANPDSMRAAIDVLAAQSAPRVLVIGEMGEVGDEGPAFHREIGAYARERGIDALFALGAATRPACDAYGAGARHFDDAAALVAALLAANFGAHATLLVKGSRFMKMERVVDALANETASGAAPGAH